MKMLIRIKVLKPRKNEIWKTRSKACRYDWKVLADCWYMWCYFCLNCSALMWREEVLKILRRIEGISESKNQGVDTQYLCLGISMDLEAIERACIITVFLIFTDHDSDHHYFTKWVRYASTIECEEYYMMRSFRKILADWLNGAVPPALLLCCLWLVQNRCWLTSKIEIISYAVKHALNYDRTDCFSAVF